MKRRTFIYDSALMAGGLFLEPWSMLADPEPDPYRLTILHTNDVHSRMDPFPDSAGGLAGLGGAARRTAVIRAIRQREAHVLLLDAGDMLQGTPYFNVFQGEVEFGAMRAMGYDAATIGNHDFDGGLELLDRHLPGLGFSLLSANYDFSGTVLADRIPAWQVFRKGPIRVGVFGLGIALDGLVPPALYGATRYEDPLQAAARVSRHLRREERCHLVVCLSHLGYRYEDDRVSDEVLASGSEDIDLILGGHTHTLLREPVMKTNARGKQVLIAQVGWGGAYLGRLDVRFDKALRTKRIRPTLLPLAH